MSLVKRVADLLSPKPNQLPSLSGRTFVLGSAPRLCPPAPGDWTFATVNASQAILAGWGHTPTITLLGRTWRRLNPTKRSVRHVMNGLRTKHLIGVGTPRNYRTFKTTARELNYGYENLSILTTDKREAIVRQMLGHDFDVSNKLSNGVILGLLALHQGADEVVLSGLSLTQSGHAYNDVNQPREHVDADALGLACAMRRGLALFTNDAAFAAESGLTLKLD